VESFVTFGRRNLAGLTKLHSTCPQLYFDAIFFGRGLFISLGLSAKKFGFG